MNILDVESEIIYPLLPSQPEGIHLGNPSFAQRNNTFVVFDYIDENQGINAIRAIDLFTGLGLPIKNTDDKPGLIEYNILENGYFNLGYPRYSPEDNAIVFQRLESGMPTLRKVSIAENKIQPISQSELYITGGFTGSSSQEIVRA